MKELRHPGGLSLTSSVFASDAITFGDRLTLNLGLRFDHSRAISQDLPALDPQGHETATMIAGLGTLYTWNIVSPRLGVATKLSADGRTMLRASYGRFSQGVLTGEFGSFHTGVSPITTRAFDAATGGYTTLVSVVDPKVQLQLDSQIRAPYSDEYSVGLDRELGRRLGVAVAYVHKDGSNFIGWSEVGGQYRQETRTLADGSSLPVLVLVNAASARRFQLTNPEGYSLTYNGLVTTIEKRPSRGWRAFGSYTFSRAEGLQVSSGTTAAAEQLSTLTSSGVFGRDPNDLQNARGRLANDRPHMFRVMGSVDVPRTGFVLAANYRYFSGKPWAATTQVALGSQGSRRILLEAPGSRRLSSQSLLDFRVSRRSDSAPPRTRRAVARPAQSAQRHSRRRGGDGQPFQLDVRTAERVHEPAARHAERAAEPGTVNDASSTPGHRLLVRGARVWSRTSRPTAQSRSRPSVYQTTLEEPNQMTPEITTEELVAILAAKSEPVLDVRTAKEYAIGHIPGTINVFERELQRISELYPDRDTRMICTATGRRAERASGRRSNSWPSATHTSAAISSGCRCGEH